MRTLTRITLAILAALTLTAATAQKDFEDVSTSLFRALEAEATPCSRFGIGPFEYAYSRCGIIFDSLTAINKAIIERHFENAGYSMIIPWEIERDAELTMHFTLFGRPERGTLRYGASYADSSEDVSFVILLAVWP